MGRAGTGRMRTGGKGAVPCRRSSWSMALSLVMLMLCTMMLTGGDAAAGPPAAVSASRIVGASRMVARQGVMDLRGWMPTDGGAIDLAGEWQVAWRRLIPGDQADAAGAAWTPARVPGIWNDQILPDGRRMGGRGAATYRLRLLLPPDCPALTVKVPQIKSAARIWLNGRVVAAAGRPAPDAGGEVASTRTLFLTIPAGVPVADLVFEISNHFHFEGGIGSVPVMRAGDALPRAWNLLMLINCGVAFSLVMLAAYIGAFSWRRAAAGQRTLCALLLLVAMRMACTGEILGTAFPDLSATLLYRLEYLPIYLFMPVYYLTLADLYPGYLHRLAGMFFSVLGLVGVAYVLLAPPIQFTRLRDPASLLLGIAVLYFLWRIAVAAWANEFGARLLGVGALLFMGSVIHDAMMYAHLFDGIDLTPFGVTAFMFTHGLILGRRVLHALNQVRQLSGELAVLNDGLERQVQERTSALRQQSALVETVLRTAKERAEGEAEVKSRFLAHLSHEVRTPMNAILGMVRLLLRDRPAPGQAERLRLIDQSARRLVRLLDEVLGLARLEAGKVTVRAEATELGALVRDVCALLEPQARDKGLWLEVAVEPGAEGWYRLDPLRFQQILVNLISNALKFTTQGGVTVGVAAGAAVKGKAGPDAAAPAAGPHVVLTVGDTGPGIPEDVRAHVFEAFARIESGAPVQGFGLGLSIVHGLVQALQGSIAVADRPGGGTLFTIRLPVAAASPPAPGDALAPVPTFRRPLNILAVEDAPENQAVLLQFLEPAGHRVRMAASGGEALRHLAEDSFDLVLLDIRLRGMDGLEVARHIRARPDDKALIPLIAITANVSEQDKAACRAADIDEVLHKPLDPDLLMAALVRHAPSDAVVFAPPSPPVSPPRLATEGGLGHLFTSVCRDQMAALAAALVAGDHARLTAIAHRLKGSAATYGHRELAAAAAILEGAGEGAGDPAVFVDAVLVELRRSVTRLMADDPAS